MLFGRCTPSFCVRFSISDRCIPPRSWRSLTVRSGLTCLPLCAGRPKCVLVLVASAFPSLRVTSTMLRLTDTASSVSLPAPCGVSPINHHSHQLCCSDMAGHPHVGSAWQVRLWHNLQYLYHITLMLRAMKDSSQTVHMLYRLPMSKPRACLGLAGSHSDELPPGAKGSRARCSNASKASLMLMETIRIRSEAR